MTRNKDTESHQRMATEHEMKDAEKARENQVEIEEETEVEEWKDAELKKGVTQKQQKGQQTVTDSLKKPGRMQKRIPKNGKHEMEVEIEKVAKALKEAQSAAEVPAREEQSAHNKESRTTSSTRRRSGS